MTPIDIIISIRDCLAIWNVVGNFGIFILFITKSRWFELQSALCSAEEIGGNQNCLDGRFFKLFISLFSVNLQSLVRIHRLIKVVETVAIFPQVLQLAYILN